MTKEQILHWWIVFNAACFGLAVLSWPVTSLTIFRKEPQGILGLSWIAIIIGAMGNLIAVLILQKVDEDVG